MNDSESKDNSKSYIVLSIDGGGFRGLACLMILMYFMTQISGGDDEDPPPPKPCQIFDLICGASTGGLIAILLGRFGLSCEEAMQVYREVGATMFDGETDSGKIWEHIIERGCLPSSMFEEKLENLVATYTGSKGALFNPPKSAPDTVSHDSTKTFVNVVPKIGSAGVDAHRIRSYTRPLRGVDPTPFGHKWSIFEAARGTCATPLYLSPLKIPIGHSTFTYQDAGYSGFNNPAKAAIDEAEKVFGADTAITLVSLGTGLRSLVDREQHGTGANKKVQDEYVDGFAQQMLKNLEAHGKDTPDALQVAKRVAKQLLEVANDTEITHLHMHEQFRRQRRQQHYFRFNPDRGLGDIELTDFREEYPIQSVTSAWLINPEEQDAISLATETIKRHYELKNMTQPSEATRVTNSDGIPIAGPAVASQTDQEPQRQPLTASVVSRTQSDGSMDSSSSVGVVPTQVPPPAYVSRPSLSLRPSEIETTPIPAVLQGSSLIQSESPTQVVAVTQNNGISKGDNKDQTYAKPKGRFSTLMKRWIH